MAQLDKLCEFCDATSVAAAAGTTLIGSQIPLGNSRDPGNGRPVYLNITCDVAIITGGTAGLIQFKLASDSTAVISATTSTIHLITPNLVTDDTGTYSVGGTTGVQAAIGDILFSGPIPVDGQNPYELFLGLLLVVTTTTITAGSISAWLGFHPLGGRIYPNAI